MNEKQIESVKKLTVATKQGKIKWSGRCNKGLYTYVCTHDINYTITVKYIKRQSVSINIECQTDNPFTVLDVSANYAGPVINHSHVLEPLVNAINEYIKECSRKDAFEALDEFLETL
jgi:hypothetical protein